MFEHIWTKKIFPNFFSSKVFKFAWKMWNLLNRNQISDFYFSSYGHFCNQMPPIFDRKDRKIDFSFVSEHCVSFGTIKNIFFLVNFLRILRTKSTISHKLKIGKLIFHSFLHIPHLSCKYELFWNFLVEKHFIQLAEKKMVGGFAPHRGCIIWDWGPKPHCLASESSSQKSC